MIRHPALRTPSIAPFAIACLFAACTRPGGTAQPITVPEPDAGVVEVAEEASTLPSGGSDAAALTDAGPEVSLPGGGGGLWVVDAEGKAIGLLIGRGHPLYTNDPLQDAITVYSPYADLSFTVRMSTGRPVMPKLGMADGNCANVVVAGNYPSMDEPISAYQTGVAFKSSWYRVKGGEPLQLVACAGTSTQGDDPACVPHSGSCRGFPVEKIPAGTLPAAWAPPLRIVWTGGI